MPSEKTSSYDPEKERQKKAAVKTLDENTEHIIGKNWKDKLCGHLKTGQYFSKLSVSQ